jgi:hypothetical protein
LRPMPSLDISNDVASGSPSRDNMHPALSWPPPWDGVCGPGGLGSRGGRSLGVDVTELVDDAPATAWLGGARGITTPWPNVPFSVSDFIIMTACWAAFCASSSPLASIRWAMMGLFALSRSSSASLARVLLRLDSTLVRCEILGELLRVRRLLADGTQGSRHGGGIHRFR